MKMPPFDYACPATLDEAVRLLAANDGAKVLSGGQSLLPLLAFRMAYPPLLVDIQKLPGLETIDVTANGLRVGARVRWCQIEQDARLATAHPLFQAMIDHVAHYQIRNRGTVGGSLAHADPSAEMPGVALVCDCEIVAIGQAGTRVIEAADFFVAALETALASDEIITEVRFPRWQPGRRWAFHEFARRKGDFAMAGVAVFFDLDGDGRIVDPHVGVIGAGETPLRLTAVEQLLAGCKLDDGLIARAKTLASDSVAPSSDIHASGDYRKSLVGTLTARALRDAGARKGELR
ncbi:Molybdopterin dehydrogenase, FAD-binding [Rhodopseudomonas palustris HaA2]|uniref:Molybdopterin dehydrogenase, FAD-binding n=1 Tax=Rhodopseudomonas palustris (strain HaA2) TaxID=316058 RepID=Q2IVE9_RHOP2|nr:xanthine dehydrogenase family protein subunit M [Rhodopseudomonas palustris]ABD07811.1 Molybdopterin dehydrogenase, FAD-binding [Rhodopseudomonas palustris HaA2]